MGEEERPLTWDEATALIRVILRMDARLDKIEAMLDELLDGDDGEEEADA